MRLLLPIVISTTVAIGCLPGAFAAEVQGTVNFDTAADLGDFHTWGSDVLWSGGGVNNSGAVSNFTPGTYQGSTLTYLPRSFSMSEPDDLLELSMMFRYTAPTQISNGGGIGVDIAGVRLYADPNPDTYTSRSLSVAYHVSQGTIGGPITYLIDIGSYTGLGGNGQGYVVTPLADGHWYRFTTLFSFDPDTNRNQFEVTVDDFGLTGLAFEGNHFAETLKPNLPALFNDSTAWGGIIMGQAHDKGADRVDNFSFLVPVPEPPSALLAFGGLAALTVLGVRRGRRMVHAGRS